MSGLLVDIFGLNGRFPLKAEFESGHGVTAIFGHSGAGKTTLLRMISGTLKPVSGHISVGDLVLFDKKSGINLPPEKRRIGYVFQDARLFPNMSVKRNLTYAQWAGQRDAKVPFEEVVELLGLKDKIHQKPTQLSGGERQRVAIGRALLSDPTLLLLDEPLSSLDRPRRLEILPYLELLRDQAGVPIVYVSHETDEVARLADTLVLLENGKVVASGPVAKIFPFIDDRSEDSSVLLEGIVTAYDQAFQLANIDLGGANFQLTDESLDVGQRLRLRVRARDVSIALKRPEQTSIRNILETRLIGLGEQQGAHIYASLDCNGQMLRTKITRKSASEMHLQKGDLIYAMIKAVSVDRAASI